MAEFKPAADLARCRAGLRPLAVILLRARVISGA
jgi:hypothetical protein